MSGRSISSFFVFGVSYKKTDASTRGLFALVSAEDYKRFFILAGQAGITECFVISTCNRTEIYGFTGRPGDLADALCDVTQGNRNQFDQIAYHSKGEEAIRHLFRVAAGLDSQILGDYEIIGQLKNSFKMAKAEGFLGPNLERLANEVLRATKKVRSNTLFSSGTVSVSFAAIQFISDFFPSASGKKILLIGTGKIGAHTCKNLVDYLSEADITLMNRTSFRAEVLANTLNLKHRPFEELAEATAEADAVLIATGAHEPILHKEHFNSESHKLVIDLSIPFNVSPEVKDYPGVRLVGVDELSKVKDDTLQMRAAEIPKVEAIIEECLAEFLHWYDMRKHVPVLKAVKSTLLALQAENIHESPQPDDLIDQLVKGVAVKMKTHYQPGCHYIEAISHFMSPASGN